jgi:glucan phosphoethanolaminetransferase (alkaline phosphatase superfamily)
MIWKYIIAWFGMMILAVINGAVRDFIYKPYAGDSAAHQISTVILLILLAIYIRWLTNRWRLHSPAQAWIVGILWFLMTEMFEFGMGLKQGMSWKQMLHAYNILEGQTWILIPLWVLIGPFVCFRLSASRKKE